MAKIMTLSAKVLVAGAEGRILLLRRAAGAKANPGKWDLPGGKVELGEDFTAALAREVLEETGLEIEIEDFARSALRQVEARKIVYLFLNARATGGEIRVSPEHDAAEWAAPEEILNRELCPQFVPFLKDWMTARQRR